MTHRQLADEVTNNELQWEAIARDARAQPRFRLLRPLDPLASKKSQVVRCAICDSPATLQCISCHEAWCSHDHYLLDDESIHQLVCQKLTELWYIKYEREHQALGEDVQTKRMQDTIQQSMQLELCNICTGRANMYMADRNFVLCLAPALRALQNAE